MEKTEVKGGSVECCSTQRPVEVYVCERSGWLERKLLIIQTAGSRKLTKGRMPPADPCKLLVSPHQRGET